MHTHTHKLRKKVRKWKKSPDFNNINVHFQARHPWGN